MPRPKYLPDPAIKAVIDEIITVLPEYYGHIDPSRLYVYRSYNTRSGALARIHGLPRIWQLALGAKPSYIIEIIARISIASTATVRSKP